MTQRSLPRPFALVTVGFALLTTAAAAGATPPRLDGGPCRARADGAPLAFHSPPRLERFEFKSAPPSGAFLKALRE